MGDTRCVPWKEGGNGGTVSQVTMLGDWDEKLDPGEWWVVSQGSNGEGGKKGKKRKREKKGGTFRVPGACFLSVPRRAVAPPCLSTKTRSNRHFPNLAGACARGGGGGNRKVACRTVNRKVARQVNTPPM